MALKIEGVVDRSMHAEGALSGSSRFEPLHLPFSSPHRLMRILGAIVLPEPLLMEAGQLQLPERRAVGAQLVSYQQFRHKPLLSEQLAHQPQRRSGVATALDPACRGPRPRGRRPATGTSVRRRSEPRSPQGAIGYSGEGTTRSTDAVASPTTSCATASAAHIAVLAISSKRWPSLGSTAAISSAMSISS